ncbi:hypothetical protein QE152_g4308 [Popillia japonica]|uniref:Uncharacterized protein n=1 Tax=Popillia japonica TaxID=7064 RepID=A0AAW1N142_POPJA
MDFRLICFTISARSVKDKFCDKQVQGRTSSSSAALEHRSVSSYRLEVLKISYTDVKRLDRPRITSDLSTRIGARIGLVFKIGTS